MNLYALLPIKKLIVTFLLFTLVSCSPYQSRVSIGASPWPSFEFVFLANELGYLPANQYSLFELNSPTSVVQAFQTGKLDVAFISLDEVLTLVALGLDLKIISVVDNSIGGDALLAKPEIKSLEQLKWRSIGYENKAAGALLLDEVFSLSNLNNQTVQLHEVKQNELKDAYLKGAIDALIVREPFKQLLLALGAKELINSNTLEQPITHVVVARSDVLQQKELQISNFLKQYYRAYQFYLDNKSDALATMAVRLQIYPFFLEDAFANTRFIGDKQSLMRLSGSPSNIELQAKRLSELMSEKHMLGQIQVDISSLVSTRILERAIYE